MGSGSIPLVLKITFKAVGDICKEILGLELESVANLHKVCKLHASYALDAMTAIADADLNGAIPMAAVAVDFMVAKLCTRPGVFFLEDAGACKIHHVMLTIRLTVWTI